MVIPNITINISRMATRVLTDEELTKILRTDVFESGAPGFPHDPADEDVSEHVKELTGKTIKEYCEWRWPDNIEEQFLIVLDNLSSFEQVEGPEYAVIYSDSGAVTRNLTYKVAVQVAAGSQKYVVPMEALSNLTTI